MTGTQRRYIAEAAGLILLALALRAPLFGNPAMQIDEQFYLLVGDRMHQGALPYADFWDRKPAGLFLIYYLIRFLGGDGVIQYQIVATLFAAATAWMIVRIAEQIAPRRGAIAAGVAYLAGLHLFGGEGGQAPAFYNAIVAGAAWLVLHAITRPGRGRTLFDLGGAAMLLLGVAIQVKYSVIGEGLYFGLALMLATWRRGARPLLVIAAGAVWAAIALVPTGIVWAWFAAHGHGAAFVFTNFESVFLRAAPEGAELIRRILRIVLRILPLAAAALAGGLMRPAEGARAAQRFLCGWAIAAALSVALFGTYHDHYALPLLVPFTIVAAPAFAWLWAVPGGPRARRIRIAPVAIAVIGFALVMGAKLVADARVRRGGPEEMRTLIAAIGAPRPDCLFVFSGDPAIYLLSGACIPTRYNFPTLLSESRDAASLGIDPRMELARVMVQERPGMVVTHDGFPFAEADPEAWRFMRFVLERDYTLALRQPLGTSGRHRLLYVRRTP
ncbi:ArnT family glycosyltransferase [Sphingomonas canadensis]|uniref:ArnT family glycosyltransferase n=1 Tax=Sphingomonas canadensis TaxID=1219257 RepID=A0ABW3H064_9SPHN|nr:hypothetical protein [Sphingomonas canadensis]MCW3835230.1 hypothetical protein [Sphingomonas canadensis]